MTRTEKQLRITRRAYKRTNQPVINDHSDHVVCGKHVFSVTAQTWTRGSKSHFRHEHMSRFFFVGTGFVMMIWFLIQACIRYPQTRFRDPENWRP